MIVPPPATLATGRVGRSDLSILVCSSHSAHSALRLTVDVSCSIRAEAAAPGDVYASLLLQTDDHHMRIISVRFVNSLLAHVTVEVEWISGEQTHIVRIVLRHVEVHSAVLAVIEAERLQSHSLLTQPTDVLSSSCFRCSCSHAQAVTALLTVDSFAEAHR